MGKAPFNIIGSVLIKTWQEKASIIIIADLDNKTQVSHFFRNMHYLASDESTRNEKIYQSVWVKFTEWYNIQSYPDRVISPD